MTLLAKSGDNPPTLFQHTIDVTNAAEAIFGTVESPTQMGKRWLRFFKIPNIPWQQFHVNLLASCALHDWGKANDGFQDMVRRKGEQVIRHEHFSALLIAQPVVWSWLGGIEGIDREIVLSSVLTHHLKAGARQDGFAVQLGTRKMLVSYHDDPEFQSLVEQCSKRFDSKLELTSIPTNWAFEGRGVLIRKEREFIQRKILRPFNEAVHPELGNDERRRRLLHAVRAALIAADAAGSGLTREKKSIREWIDASMTNLEPLTKETIWNDIITPRVNEQKAKGNWRDKRDGRNGWNDFQIEVESLLDRALLMAPCGSGKTLAAWRWIANQLKNRPAKHVLFLYPTRATAREGFKDYVSWAPEADAKLMHGASGFDLAGMFSNEAGDPRKNRDYEVERRLFSLGYWGGRAFSATVDQFLGFMQYGYGPLCMLPVLSDSIVVIDEVHSFDRNMFSALKDFLKNFDIPVLCMTATLQKDREADLIGCGLSAPKAWPEDLKRVADLPRYRVRCRSFADSERRVRDALSSGKRVLWVVNQVRRAHALVKAFASGFDPLLESATPRTPDGAPVICYHSRYRLEDRVHRHAETMAALKKDSKGPALGITTQVCEMSLDIDVDLLVTEDCPVTSLVQRMGRCNRQSNARCLNVSGEVLIVPPMDGNNLPYSKNDLAGLTEFRQAVEGNELSQSKIEEVLQSVPSPELEGDVSSRFLTSGPYAVGPRDEEGEGFREGNDFNRPCILASEVERFHNAEKKLQAGFVLPVPVKFSWLRDPENPKHSKLPGHLGVAAHGHYHPAIGFSEIPLSDWRTS